MRKPNFPLRLRASLMEEARKAAASEGVALDQLINVALAEKISALRTEEYFLERMRRADRAETLWILDRAGKRSPPLKGDELPSNRKGAGEIGEPLERATPQSGKLKKRQNRMRPQ